MTIVEPRQLRDACGAFGTGVTIITTHADGHDHGMTANAFMSISLDPPLVAISIREQAKMLPRIQQTGRFAVSILAHRMEGIAWHFAGKPMPDAVDFFERREGIPVIKGAVATFVTHVVNQVLAGDHTVFIGKVSSMTHDPAGQPLLFHRGRFGGMADPHPAPALMENCSYELLW